MKKLLLSLLVVVVIVGCGKNADKKTAKNTETKTCTMEMQGIAMSLKMDATKDIINVMTLDMSIPPAITQGEDLSKLTEADLNKTGKVVMDSLGVTEGKGITVTYTVKDKILHGVIAIDMKNGDTAILKKLGFLVDTKDVKLSETTQSMEKNGYTCK